jgi:cysteinyl-tRNA synthetase
MSEPKLRLYNTLTRQKEDFIPLDLANVRMYVCGPTVYDYAHIGNARPVIVFDVLFRLLRHLYGEAHVTYARNITDVDDKINARALRDHPGLPLNDAIAKVTQPVEEKYMADARALGCLDPTTQPRATAHLDQMRAIIERLVQRGAAYVAENHVLFSVSAMEGQGNLPKYGSLARRSLDEMLAGARVEVAPYKRDPMDFVLWKPSDEGMPGWPSPCGIEPLGRPGWHIECSAMSMATLLSPFGGGLDCDDPDKNTFDIHGGGVDLVFPHHENEIAQSCCAFGSARMANIWMHNGFLQVEGEKMSKSLGNFVTIDDLLKNWPGPTVRLNMLRTHYLQPIDWTEKGLLECEEKLCEISTTLKKYKDRYDDWCINCEPTTDLIEVLSDNLNTSEAFTLINSYLTKADNEEEFAKKLFSDLKFLNIIQINDIDYYCPFVVVDEKHELLSNDGSLSPLHPVAKKIRAAILNRNAEDKVQALTEVRNFGFEFVEWNDPTYGLAYGLMPIKVVYRDKITSLISERTAARTAKNFAESDRIRDELVAMGIEIQDAKDFVTGELSTTWRVKP